MPAALALGAGVVATPQLVADEALYARADKAQAVVQVADSRAAALRPEEDLGW